MNTTSKSSKTKTAARILILIPLIATVLGLFLFFEFKLNPAMDFEEPLIKMPFELAVVLIKVGDILLPFSLIAGIPMSVAGMVLAIKQKMKAFIVLSVITIILIMLIYLAIIVFFAFNEGLFPRTPGTVPGQQII